MTDKSNPDGITRRDLLGASATGALLTAAGGGGEHDVGAHLEISSPHRGAERHCGNPHLPRNQYARPPYVKQRYRGRVGAHAMRPTNHGGKP